MPISQKIETVCFHLNALTDIIFPGEPISQEQYEKASKLLVNCQVKNHKIISEEGWIGFIRLPDSNKPL